MNNNKTNIKVIQIKEYLFSLSNCHCLKMTKSHTVSQIKSYFAFINPWETHNWRDKGPIYSNKSLVERVAGWSYRTARKELQS